MGTLKGMLKRFTNKPASILHRQDGVTVAILILIIMVVSVLGIALISLVTNLGNMISINQLAGTQAFYIAEAGIERAVREIRDDASTTQTTNPAADGYCMTPSLDGYSATSTSGTATNACFYTSANNSHCDLTAATGQNVQVYNFQQRYNLMNTPIQAMEIGFRAVKNSSGGTSPIIQLQYTLTGGAPWTPVGSPITVSATAWGTPVYVAISTTPTWANLLDGTSFRIQAYRTNAAGTSRTTYVDYLCIRVKLRADAVTEPWYTTFKNSDGTTKTVNLSLGSGVLESAPIDDEQGKVHLNYAASTLLSNLMIECSIASARAATLATNIVANRNYNSVEELLKPAVGMTTAEYNLIRNYVTVYSWVNSNVQKLTGSRAPININTAPVQVLEAVFDPLGLGATDPATLAAAIITRRATTPFSSMYSTNPDDTSSSFGRFVDTQTAYLTAAEISAVKENCDASLYNLTLTTSWTTGNCTTTEFCYSSPVYSVTSTGKVQNTYRETRRVFKDDSSFNISIPWGTTLNYWKEIIP